MEDIYIIPLFIIGCVFISFIIVFSFFIIIKLSALIVLPEKYSELKQKYPYPLHGYSCLSGSLKFGLIPLYFRGFLKIDVYEKMIIVSSMGQGLCLPYDKYIFEQRQILFYHALVVKTLSEDDKGYKQKSKSILEIHLSQDKIDTILHLAYK